MSLWGWLLSWFSPQGAPAIAPPRGAKIAHKRRRRPRHRLDPLRRNAPRTDPPSPQLDDLVVRQKPYAYARPCVLGGYLDLSQDGDNERLEHFGLPVFHTPLQLADWLGISTGKLSWLVHCFEEHNRPPDERAAHYHYVWIDKRRTGQRLIEAPKPLLKTVQTRILQEILARVPAHTAAHGFIKKRSIRTNAEPHVGQRVIVKYDLENFYATVSFSRVVALFRSLGYSREAGIWLARLTTSSLPESQMRLAPQQPWLKPYLHRHLPQGAPTSPAIANLSAFVLDLRLAGLSRTFRARYTRYADDLTFSGGERFRRSLAVFLPLVSQIVRSERFHVNKAKRRIIRNNQRQQIAGVVVNDRIGIRRDEYDRLKAMLTNCIRRGPSTQNHEHHTDFAGYLRGKIAHVQHLHPQRGEKLLALYSQIDWRS